MTTNTLSRHSPDRRGVHARIRSDAGFSFIEMLIVCIVAGIAMSFAVMGIGHARTTIRSNGAIAQLKEQLTIGRETAVSQQRDVRLEFVEPNVIRLTRIDIPEGETVLREITLEGGMTFTRYASLDPTPDPWGGDDEAIAFGEYDTLRFRSDGALVNEDNEYVNGRVFVGWTDNPASAGFVSVFGATGRLRSYRAGSTTAWIH